MEEADNEDEDDASTAAVGPGTHIVVVDLKRDHRCYAALAVEFGAAVAERSLSLYRIHCRTPKPEAHHHNAGRDDTLHTAGIHAAGVREHTHGSYSATVREEDIQGATAPEGVHDVAAEDSRFAAAVEAVEAVSATRKHKWNYMAGHNA